MFRTTLAVALGLTGGALSGGCSVTVPVQADSLTFRAAKQWVREEPEHVTRKLQFRIPSGEKGMDDARVIVWNFANMRDAGDGRMIERNMQRWESQFLQDDLTPSGALGRRAEFRVNGLPVHTIDLAGCYVAETAPGSGMRVNKPSYRMLGAYIVAPQGDYLVKLAGPADVVARHAGEFDTFIKTVRADGNAPHPAMRPPSGRQKTTLTATPDALPNSHRSGTDPRP